MAFVIRFDQETPKNCWQCPCSTADSKVSVFCHALHKHIEVLPDSVPIECGLEEVPETNIQQRDPEYISCRELKSTVLDVVNDYVREHFLHGTYSPVVLVEADDVKRLIQGRIQPLLPDPIELEVLIKFDKSYCTGSVSVVTGIGFIDTLKNVRTNDPLLLDSASVNKEAFDRIISSIQSDLKSQNFA